MIREFGTGEVIYIVLAIRWTIALSLIAFLGGALGGLTVALARVSDNTSARLAATGFIRLFQGTPLLMQLFIVYFGLNIVGLPTSAWLAAAVALTLHASAFLGEIWRGCIQAVPRGQTEAADALAYGYVTRLKDVILPQAARIAAAPTTGFLVQLIKSTSLASIIGFTELTRAGQVISNATFKPFVVISLVAVLYFILCWPLSLAAKRLESRFDRAVAR
ncbi:amino acid ABC transporter permease [Cognatishimia maritima]|uniref:Polar amino acid transport system permease protein n=1 Tax=Cognatishimia maritima TaxID=870908 RepID=A0A1M5QQN9_9RHOB|nr:amino acid ABC transporter permease [Cognatishimia maritima]SHH15903.1 polar amino acid transport system permease protein [Cognatishimia maritima]